MAARCCECDCGFDVRPLYRVNPLGEVPAVWACQKCRPDVPDPETARIAEIIHRDGK